MQHWWLNCPHCNVRLMQGIGNNDNSIQKGVSSIICPICNNSIETKNIESFIFCKQCEFPIFSDEKSCKRCGYIPNRTINNNEPVTTQISTRILSAEIEEPTNTPFTTCPKCQAKITSNEKKCMRCGYILKQSTPELTTPTPKNTSPIIIVSGKKNPYNHLTAKPSYYKQTYRSQAIKLFKNKGYPLDKSNTTYAKEINYQYWLNPKKTLLDENWYIILNDIYHKKLFLLHIPPNSIKSSSLLTKYNNPDLFDILIRKYDFIDEYSDVSFEEFLIDTLEYDKIT